MGALSCEGPASSFPGSGRDYLSLTQLLLMSRIFLKHFFSFFSEKKHQFSQNFQSSYEENARSNQLDCSSGD